MMQSEFQNQISRIKIAFGEKFYDAQRVFLIWQHAKGVHFNVFASICTTFIEGSRYAPLPKDFIEALQKAKNRKNFRRRSTEHFGGALSQIESRVKNRGRLESFLESNYGVKNLVDAVEVQRKRNRSNKNGE